MAPREESSKRAVLHHISEQDAMMQEGEQVAAMNIYIYIYIYIYMCIFYYYYYYYYY